jgi:hypothetical protein
VLIIDVYDVDQMFRAVFSAIICRPKRDGATTLDETENLFLSFSPKRKQKILGSMLWSQFPAIFYNFGRKIGIFIKNNVMIIFLQKIAVVWAKKLQCFGQTFLRKYFKNHNIGPCLVCLCPLKCCIILQLDLHMYQFYVSAQRSSWYWHFPIHCWILGNLLLSISQ